MIANEMKRAANLMAAADRHSRALASERALRLADLTVEVNPHRPLRDEPASPESPCRALRATSNRDPPTDNPAGISDSVGWYVPADLP